MDRDVRTTRAAVAEEEGAWAVEGGRSLDLVRGGWSGVVRYPERKVGF